MNDGLIGIIGTLLGTLLGFTLSELTTSMRNRRTRQNMRAVIVDELDMNIQVLYICIVALKYETKDMRSPVSIREAWKDFPSWSNPIWQSQLPVAVSTLKPKEIQLINSAYGLMKRVTNDAHKLHTAPPDMVLTHIKYITDGLDHLINIETRLEIEKSKTRWFSLRSRPTVRKTNNS